MFVNPGFEGLKIVSARKDGGREGVPVSCFSSFFRNISKTAETILIKKIGRNHGISIDKKALISEHRTNYIFRDNNCFVKMSVSLLVSLLRWVNHDLMSCTPTSTSNLISK